MPSDFVHLHVHSVYSLLDGACRIPELVTQAKAQGQKAIALTDHGVMYGLIPFYQAAKAAGIQPILGCEVYVAPKSRLEKTSGREVKNYHLILLCENQAGYRNLVKLVSASHLEGFYYKPRVDLELLQRYHEGLICLSGCFVGEIPSLLRAGREQDALQKALEYQQIFGKDNYFLEIQDHGLAEDQKLTLQLMKISQKTGIPLVATNDVHYVKREDASTQEVLMCIQTGQTLSDPNHMKFPTNEFYLKSTEEMETLFSNIPQAITNTVKIAERCHVEFEKGKIWLPAYERKGVTDNLQFFKALCEQGMMQRYGEHPSQEVLDRLHYEMDVIQRMGYVDYFLIVWDYIHYARSQNIPVGPGRGSGAGSLCAYCMDITRVDPIRYHLLFERFLNPERVSMPDFDVDFCVNGRQKVKEYVIEKYGSNRVSEIITFNLMKAKEAVRDAGRALGISYGLCDRIAKAIPSNMTISQALQSPEGENLRLLSETDSNAKKLLKTAMGLEDMPRHTSTHAAGVLISAIPITELVPLQMNEGMVSTQYPMGILEQMGLLKFDFLGLRNLTMMQDALRLIHRKDPTFDLETIPDDDAEVYAMLGRGETTGVFQFESSGIRKVLMRMQPKSIEDLTAVLSLYRPGPMGSIDTYLENRKNPRKIQYAHPLLEPILRTTYGVIVYQEQVMEICRALAGYSYGRADLVRRAMSKKKHDVMEKERTVFLYGDAESNIAGCIANGVSEQIANRIFDEIAGFASYAFNKSHAVAYAWLAYQTAYLRCHWFPEDMAALLTSVSGESGKLMEYINACRRSGLEVLPPHVNASTANFQAEGEKIRYGLLALKGVGQNVSNAVEVERKLSGQFKSLRDFCTRMLRHGLNRQTLESLMKAGALDGMGLNRRQLTMVEEKVLEDCRSGSRRRAAGQLSLFGGEDSFSQNPEDAIADVAEFSDGELAAQEREILGFYLRMHPLNRIAWMESLMHCQESRSFASLPDKTSVRFFVILQKAKTYTPKKGGEMCFLTAEDRCGVCDIVLFSQLYETVQNKLHPDTVLLIRGKISHKEDSVSILADSVLEEEEVLHFLEQGKLCVKLHSQDMQGRENFLKIAKSYPGKTGLCLYFTDLRKTVTSKQVPSAGISKAFCTTLQKQFGNENVGILLP